MASIYDEIEIEDMTWDLEKATFFYPCPCGDRFFLPLEDIQAGEDVARCPSCSLRIRVIFDEDAVAKYAGQVDAAAAAATAGSNTAAAGESSG